MTTTTQDQNFSNFTHCACCNTLICYERTEEEYPDECVVCIVCDRPICSQCVADALFADLYCVDYAKKFLRSTSIGWI